LNDLQVFELEPERYELIEAPKYRFEPDRREFLKTLGAGILIVSLIDRVEAQRRGNQSAPQDIGSWLHIGNTGKVTVFTGKAEVGQNARTSLTQAVAEELGAPAAAVELVMADTERVPYDMGTFGSMTTPRMAPQLRRAAAAARKMFPAGDWASLKFDRGDGELRAASIDADLKPNTPLGQSVPKVNGHAFVTGGHKYTSDMQVPGMLYGRMIRPEQYGAAIQSFDATDAEKLPGVKAVRDGNFAGVVATGTSAAAHAAKACKVEWKAVDESRSSSDSIYADLKAGAKIEMRQDLEDALAASKQKIERTYTVAYIAHVPLEPRAAVAQWSDSGKLTVWTGTQVPFGVRDELAGAFGLKPVDVRVVVPDTGSGYGGKHSGECAVEAARLAKAAGKPVKLVWTREEEFMWAYFRPAGVIDVRSGIDEAGRLTAWDFHNYNSGGSAIQTPYDVPVKRAEFHNAKSPLRQGSYRGLAATANHFAREVHMDELARLAKIDPLEFRLKNTSDPRLKAVLVAAAEKFGWSKSKGAIGIAGGFEKGGYVACCAEVAPAREAGKPPKIVRLVEAFECGAVVNPEHLKMQIEGGMVMGLGGALFEAVEFAGGRLLNGRLSKYRVPRFRDIPSIEAVLVDRKDLPSMGAGETPIVGVAPAIANAVFAATGERLRALPLFKSQGSGSRREAETN
jgi:nicotinate dehydrogenase subunit B